MTGVACSNSAKVKVGVKAKAKAKGEAKAKARAKAKPSRDLAVKDPKLKAKVNAKDDLKLPKRWVLTPLHSKLVMFDYRI